MSEEEIKNIIYLKNKPISSCKDLHKYFIGRHNEPIIVCLTPKFEIEFENNFYKLECLEQENQKYKEVINKTIKWVRDYMNEWDVYDEVYHDLNDLLILLKEVEHEKRR